MKSLKSQSLKSIIKIASTSIFAVLAVYLLLSKIDLSRIPEVLTGISPIALFISFGLYAFFVFIKTLRFKLILTSDAKSQTQTEIPTLQLYSIVALHTFWSNLLPMRTGDLSYVYFMKTRGTVSGVKSVASLMIAGIIDLFLLMATMATIGFAFRAKLSATLSGMFLFGLPIIGCIFLISLIGTMLFCPGRVHKLLDKISSILHSRENRILLWLYDKFNQLLQELTDISFNWRFAKIMLASLTVLFLRFGMQCYLIKAMHLEIKILPILFALAFTGFCNMFPIQSIGSLGAVEAPWTLALISFGISKEDAILSGFSLHIVIIIYCVFMGLYGFVVRR